MDETGVSLEQPPAVSEKGSNPISQVVLDDLVVGMANERDGIGNIGTTLCRLRTQTEKGISLEEKGIKVVSSVAELLSPDLLQAMQTEIVYHNKPIEREDLFPGDDFFKQKKDYFIDEVLGKIFDGDAYEAVLKLHKSLYGEHADVKLVRYHGTLVVVTKHQAGERVKVIQVFDCDFPQTPAYKEFRRKVREENLDPAAWSSFEEKKRGDIPVVHLIIEDTKTGKALDIRRLLPDDWDLEYSPIGALFCSQDSDQKHLRYSELSSPERLIGLLHEYGHCVQDANSPELFRETKDLWENAQFGGLSMENFNRTKELLVRNERGASARAIQVIRILREQGLEIGVPVETITKFVNDALSSYERRYAGGTTRFLRPGVTKT